MATSAETRVVYAAGVVQGIALVTFPAASTILTDPAEYDLSETQYGALFLPQVVTAIAAALLGARPGRPVRHEAGLPRRARRRPALDDAAPRQRVLTDDGRWRTRCCSLATACLGAASASRCPR